MTNIGKMTVALYANSAQFANELQKSQKQAKTWSSGVRSAFDVAAKATIAAGTAATAALGLIYNQQAALIDQTAKFSDRIGITTEALTQLRYASELTGVGANNLDMAMQRMTRRIAEATQGAGEAAPALKQLGLDAQQLGQMTPDEQLHVLADAFTQVESQSERVRLAFKLFDSEGVGMVNMLAGGADGLKAMADEADRLGITLSRVDAAKVEMANDAMFKVNETTRAMKQEVTTQLAPIFAQLSEDFLAFSQQYGGMNALIADTIGAMVTGTGVLADSLRGVQIIMAGMTVGWEAFKIGFMVASQAIVTGLHELGRFIFNVVIAPLQAALDLAGNFSDEAARMAQELREFSNTPPPQLFDAATINQSKLDMNQAIWELRDLASQPLPSEGIEAWYQQTKAKFDQLAKDYAAGINYNQGNGEGNGEGTGTPDKVDPKVAAFRKATAQLQTEHVRRLALQAAGDQAMATQEAFAYQDRMARMSEQFQLAYEAAAGNQALQQELEDQYFANRELLWQQHQDNLSEIEKQAAQARMAQQAVEYRNYSDLFGSMSDIAKTFAGEQSGIYKAMFAASKAFAIAESIIKIQQGLASAAALPFPANLPAMASVAAATAGIVSTISSTNLTGMAHSGISSVPREGTWLLDKGERVYTNDSAKQLDQMYSAIMAGNNKQNGNQGNVVVQLQNAPAGYTATAEQDQNEFGERVIRVILQDQQNGGEITNNYQTMWGLQRQGRF